MIIFPEIEITWADEVYTTRVTMKVINKIEQTVSIASLVTRMQSGDIPLSHLATVYACILRHAGASVSDEDVFFAMLGQDDSVDQSEVMTASANVIQACFPESSPKGKKKGQRKS